MGQDPVDVDLGRVVSIHVAKATKLPCDPWVPSLPEAASAWWVTATTARSTGT